MFATCPAGQQGWASLTLPPLGEPPADGASMAPLLDVILAHVPPPQVSLEQPFAMCVAMIERDAFVGRVATGAFEILALPHRLTCTRVSCCLAACRSVQGRV
jgi:predicted membrane GTPase involved in stress response